MEKKEGVEGEKTAVLSTPGEYFESRTCLFFEDFMACTRFIGKTFHAFFIAKSFMSQDGYVVWYFPCLFLS